MKKIKNIGVVLLLGLLFIQCSDKTEKKTVENIRMVGSQPDGSILVPTNQLLRPAGFQIQFSGRPVDLALSPNGKWMAVLNKNHLELIQINDRTIFQRLEIKKGGSYNGVTFSEDGRRIYVSQSRNHIFIAKMNDNNVLNWSDEIKFPKAKVGGHPVPGAIILELKFCRVCFFSVNKYSAYFSRNVCPKLK